jgi:hypothetical protein
MDFCLDQLEWNVIYKSERVAKVLLSYIYTVQWNMKAVVSNGKFLTFHYLCRQEYVFKIPISTKSIH